MQEWSRNFWKNAFFVFVYFTARQAALFAPLILLCQGLCLFAGGVVKMLLKIENSFFPNGH